MAACQSSGTCPVSCPLCTWRLRASTRGSDLSDSQNACFAITNTLPIRIRITRELTNMHVFCVPILGCDVGVVVVQEQMAPYSFLEGAHQSHRPTVPKISSEQLLTTQWSSWYTAISAMKPEPSLKAMEVSSTCESSSAEILIVSAVGNQHQSKHRWTLTRIRQDERSINCRHATSCSSRG